MNGEVPSVPITTLAGVASLTDLLPELPLPTPLPQTVQNKSLLYHPKLAEDAKKYLNSRDDAVIQQLTHALKQTSTEHIELKDALSCDNIDGDVPELLKALLAADPNIFKGRKHCDGQGNKTPSQQGHDRSPYQSPHISPHNQQNNSPRYPHQSPGRQVAANRPAGDIPSATRLQPHQSQRSFLAQNCVPVNGDYAVPEKVAPVPTQSQVSATVSSPAHAAVAESIANRGLSKHRPSSSAASHNADNDSAVPARRERRRSSATKTSDNTKSPGVVEPSDNQNGARRTQRRSSGSKSSEPSSASLPTMSAQNSYNSCDSRTEPTDSCHFAPERSGARMPGHHSSGTHQSVHNICSDGAGLHPAESFSRDGKTSAALRTSKAVVMLEPLDPEMLKSIAKAGKVISRDSHRSRGHREKSKYENKGRKRRLSSDDENEYDNRPPGKGECFGSYSMSLSERVKRRRRQINYADSSDSRSRDASSDNHSDSSETIVPRRKEKKHKRSTLPPMTIEELLESATFKKFNNSIEYVFDTAEEIDFGSIDEDDADAECPPESLISKKVLAELSSEAAKLRSTGVLNQMPTDKLVRLLTILQWNIRDGTKVLPNINQETDDDGEEKLWRELTMERVMRSMDSALTAMYIMTAPDMPKEVYLEEVIERTLIFAKFQLQNTLYPEFDPVYKINPKTKDGYYGSSKLKRSRAGAVKHKSSILLYNKMSDLIGALAELVEIQELTDTVVLQVSTLGVSPFFVENISEMQLNAMKLVTTVFSKYDKHRQLILEDIFASLARLPTSKRNLRNYRLNSDQSIQMVTALALQLIQCVVRLPQPEEPSPTGEPVAPNLTEHDLLIVTSYETAMRTGHNFLSVFLKKCTTKGEEDYRPLFENFVQDLLATVNKPEWPASELLLSLLGRILVQQFSNKSVDMSLRTASLEYLGIVAARLRKDAVSSRLNQETIDEIVKKINESDEDDENNDGERKKDKEEPMEQTQSLQKAMLDYLAYNSQSDSALLFSRMFYIGQWYRDLCVEADKKSKTKNLDSSFDSLEEDTEVETSANQIQNAERNKLLLISNCAVNKRLFSSARGSCKLEYENACLVARYLSSKRPFAQSFDIYLTQILRVLGETAVAVRTKAMKCLSAVVEADPGILARSDMERGVHGRFLDQSTSVREAAVELVGRFILIRPDLTSQYYDMLSERILDTGISVRKRVIKIFKDICLDQPEFKKIPEMCVKMIRRVNDEEGIKKLVSDVFQSMWFTPLRDKDSSRLLRRVVNITEVVAACKETGIDYMEQLMHNLLKPDEDGNVNKHALQACKQTVNCLVENVLKLEEKTVEVTDGKVTSGQRLVSVLSTLYLFSKTRPELVVQHGTTLQPYLDIKCSTRSDFMVLHNVARILELVVPIMEHPSETFLAQLEEDMMKLILKHGMTVLQSCVSCLGAIVNKVSHNYKLVKDCFQKFFGVLSRLMADHQEQTSANLNSKRPALLRSLFTVGLLCTHFDFDLKEMDMISVKEKVFDVFMYFISHEDEEVRLKALTGLGFLCIRHYQFMLGKRLKELYYDLLSSKQPCIRLRVQVLNNLHMYLTEEEESMAKADAEWKKMAKKEDLKEMGDIQSGMAGTVMQIYLKPVLEAFFHPTSSVRMTSLGVICLILKQGLVHPVQCVPYLICMGSDSEPVHRIKSDQTLQEIDKKYPGFVHMKALHGIKMSYKLQLTLQQDVEEPVRGMRIDDGTSQSLNGFLYSTLRANRQNRRGFVTSLLNLFDDSSRVELPELLYVADNLAFFPYQTQDEPLYMIHQIDIIASVSGSNLLQSFKESLLNKDGTPKQLNALRPDEVEEEDDDEDFNSLMARLPPDTSPLQEIIKIQQGCILLLILKQHLKDLFGFTDSKVHRYSPLEAAKVYEKPLTRKVVVDFMPSQTLELLRSGSWNAKPELDEGGKTKLLEDYSDFKQLMLSIDPPDDDDSDDMDIGRLSPSQMPNQTEDGQEGEGADGPVIIDGVERPREQNKIHLHRPGTMTTNRHRQLQYRQQLAKERKKRPAPKPKLATPKSEKKKKKKKRRRYSGSADNDDSDSDPDFIC